VRRGVTLTSLYAVAFDRLVFYIFVQKGLVAFLEALCARTKMLSVAPIERLVEPLITPLILKPLEIIIDLPIGFPINNIISHAT